MPEVEKQKVWDVETWDRRRRRREGRKNTWFLTNCRENFSEFVRQKDRERRRAFYSLLHAVVP
jgi:hypothetical protein